MLHPSFPNISPRNSQEGAASHSPSHHASANVWQGGKAASRRWQSNAQSHPGPVPPSHNSSHHISGSALQGGGKAAPPRLLQPLNPLSKAIAALQPNRERQAVSTSQIQLPPLPHIKDSKVNLTATGRIKSARILANMLSGVQLVGQELQHMREKVSLSVVPHKVGAHQMRTWMSCNQFLSFVRGSIEWFNCIQSHAHTPTGGDKRDERCSTRAAQEGCSSPGLALTLSSCAGMLLQMTD